MTKRTIIFRMLFVLYLAAVLFLCLADFSGISVIDLNDKFLGIPKDKIVHFLMFLPFPALCFLSFKEHSVKPLQSALRVILIFTTGCLIAAGTELIQELTPYRVADRLDFYADSLALAVCSIAVLIFDLSKKQ